MNLVTLAPPPGGSVGEVCLAAWMRDLWDERRPGWVDPSWWSVPLREEVAVLLELCSGPDLLAAIVALDAGTCSADHSGEGIPGDPSPGSVPGFPCGCQLVLVAAWGAVSHWTAVRCAQALTDAVAAEPVVISGDGARRPGITDPAREEVAVAIRLGVGSTAVQIRRARALAAFPAAAALASEGILPLATVERVCQEVAQLSPEDAEQVMAQWCAKVRARAGGRRPMNAIGAKRAANRLILAAPSHGEIRDRARKGRRVEVWNGDDGTAALTAVLRQEDAERVFRRLTAIARGLDDPQDCRGVDAKRADVLVDLLLGTMLSQSSGVEMNVAIPVASLLGLADGLGEVPGLGPIPAEVARELAADARWRAWLTDAAGTVVATSTTTYRPTASLARLVRARHPECRMPGCRRSADACDLDHAVPYPLGGTTLDNLGPLCERHHIQKTHYGWELDVEAGVWRTPIGAEVAIAA